mgnify:CR=1 FL=1
MTLSPRSIRKIRAIKEQASILFVRNGFQHVTMEAVAQYANVSKVTLYKYFKDKQTLYEAILMELADLDHNELKEIVRDFIPYPDKIDQLFQRTVEHYFDVNRPNLEDDFILSLDGTKFMKKHTKRMRDLRAQLWNQGRMEGHIPMDAGDAILEIYYAIVLDGMIRSWPAIEHLDESDRTTLLNTLFDGIKKTP